MKYNFIYIERLKPNFKFKKIENEPHKYSVGVQSQSNKFYVMF